jgi:hypothetical protein
MSEFCERTIGWIEAVLGAAPKGQVLPTLSLEPAEDRLARAAFGRLGGSAAARADAPHAVRRYQIASGGHWLLCDCRPDADRPPVLVPVAETHSQRQLSTQAGLSRGDGRPQKR